MIWKRSICVGLIAALGIGGYFVWHKRQTRRARVCTRKFFREVDPVVRKRMGQPLAKEELAPIFSQPFFYLGKGKQSIVYESADGQYVIKLFKNPLKKRKQKKITEAIEGAFLAWHYLPEQTGLVCCSTGEKQSFTLLLLTKKGKIDRHNLYSEPFIVQKKALPFKQALLRANEGAEHLLTSLFDLLKKMREKGIVDIDGSLIRNENLGVIDGRVVLLDTGKLHQLSDVQRQTLHDLNRLKPLCSWLEVASPELVPTFKENAKKYKSKNV